MKQIYYLTEEEKAGHKHPKNMTLEEYTRFWRGRKAISSDALKIKHNAWLSTKSNSE